MKHALLLSTILLFLSACNCHHEGCGYVFNQTSKQPIANVRIDVYSTKPWKDTISPPIYTDANGYFEYQHDFCYDMLIASAPGFINFIFSDVDKDTVYLEYDSEL